MWPDGIDMKGGTVYMEIGGLKVKLVQIKRVRLEFDNKSWRKKVWVIRDNDTWYQDLVRFEKRKAAIMWLKRYGKSNITYRLERRHGIHALVRVVNGYVYFYNPEYGLISAESKCTQPYAIRNN